MCARDAFAHPAMERLALGQRLPARCCVAALRPVQAEKTAALFVKDGDQASGIAYLHDMQHMWFECAAGRAHLRRQEFGKVSRAPVHPRSAARRRRRRLFSRRGLHHLGGEGGERQQGRRGSEDVATCSCSAPAMLRGREAARAARVLPCPPRSSRWRVRAVGACGLQALKRYTAVVKHFEDIHDDQYDFHG